MDPCRPLERIYFGLCFRPISIFYIQSTEIVTFNVFCTFNMCFFSSHSQKNDSPRKRNSCNNCRLSIMISVSSSSREHRTGTHLLIYLHTWLMRFLMAICNHPFVSVTDFPSQTGNEIEPEVRKSRAAVIASEPIPENLEIKRARVKKNVRSASAPFQQLI